MCDTSSDHSSSAAGVRVVTLHLPEDEGEGLGFKLTRTLWDPYPWVREVSAGGRADAAGLRSGDCVLQADGRDLLGLPVGQVAGMIRGDGFGHGVSLLVWSCGTSPQDDPELLWSAGGGARGERSRRALSGVLRALACAVCSATAAHKSAQCSRGHLYCAGCRARLQRCALCRESLPPVDSPQAKNLIAEQVFEAIASVYELKEALRVPTSPSVSSPPPRSPLPTPKVPQSVSQRSSPIPLRKTVQFGLSAQPYHGSDNSLNRPATHEWSLKRTAPQSASLLTLSPQSESKMADSGSQTDLNDVSSARCHRSQNAATTACCQNAAQINCRNAAQIHSACHSRRQPYAQQNSDTNCQCQFSQFVEPMVYYSQSGLNVVPVALGPGAMQGLQHRLVARLRPASSLVDLRHHGVNAELSKSLNSIHIGTDNVPVERAGSMDNLPKDSTASSFGEAVYLGAPPPPVLVWACEH